VISADPHAPVAAIQDYWNIHTLGLQYIADPAIVPGTRQFYEHVRPWMNPYKFPWIMRRIEREAALLKDRDLLEIGCGLGYDSLEFLKRGVRVTATDLTPQAVALTSRHFQLEGVSAREVRVANVLALPFADGSFDAVWANGVLHHTGDTARALREIRRVLKPGGRAIISHFYRRGSWMYLISRLGRENIEFQEEDPPVTQFYSDREVLGLFQQFQVIEMVHEHYRALPVARRGLKASLYRHIFRPLYNSLPESVAKALAYKLSVVAIKP
jgi:ubiquinone/menaquinone biosynthesis C-methylase UbiE